MKINIKDIENDINQQTAERAFRNVSFRAEERGAGEVQRYIDTITSLASHIESIAEADSRKEGMAQDVFDSLRELYKRRTLEYLASTSRCASSAVVGPANFPVARAMKRADIAQKRQELLFNLAEYLPRKAEKALAPVISRSESIDIELEENKAKLESLKSFHRFMKKTNVLFSSGKLEDLKSLFMDYYGQGQAENEIRNRLEPTRRKPYGFESFELSNNLANIRRTEERISVLEKKADNSKNEAPKVIKLKGLDIVLNHQEDRLQLVFTFKPDEPIRTLLKSNGFKWSPRFSAWQRKLTPNSMFSLKNYVLNNELMKEYENEL